MLVVRLSVYKEGALHESRTSRKTIRLLMCQKANSIIFFTRSLGLQIMLLPSRWLILFAKNFKCCIERRLRMGIQWGWPEYKEISETYERCQNFAGEHLAYSHLNHFKWYVPILNPDSEPQTWNKTIICSSSLWWVFFGITHLHQIQHMYSNVLNL